MPRPIALAAEESPNLVRNGDFSESENGKPAHWETSGNPSNVTQSLKIVMDHGNPCAQLTCRRFEGKGSGWDHAMLAQVGGVTLEKDQVYEFSCRARAENLAGRNVSVMIQDTAGWHACGFSDGLTLGQAWQEYRRVFKATRSVGASSRLQFWFNETGTFYLDDVRIVKLPKQRIGFTDVVPEIGTKNLVPNSSFELGGYGWSSIGPGAGWGNLAKLHGTIGESGGADGRRYLRIPMGGDKTPILCFDYYEPVSKPQLQVLTANLGWIPVKAGEAYTLSCNLRASAEGVSAILGVRSGDPELGCYSRQDHRHKVQLTKTWQRYTFTFRPKYRYAFVTMGPDLDADRHVDVDVDAIQLEKGEEATPYEPRLSVEFAVESSSEAGIFTQGDKESLLVRVHNSSAVPQKGQLEIQATDFFEKQHTLLPLALDVPTNSILERSVTLPSEWRGYYKLKSTLKMGERTESRELPIAIVPPRSGTDSVLGINHAFNTPYLIRLAGKAGVTWYRDWSLKWEHMEPEPGRYKWELADAQIDRVVKAGMNVLPLLPPFPSANWNSEAPTNIPATGYPGMRLRAAWAPKEPEQLKDFTAKAVARYRDRIRYWEFLNEPVYTTYALPGKQAESLKAYGGKRYEPSDYVRLLSVAAAGMKTGDPNCRIIAGIAGGPETFAREVIGAGCLKYADIFNLHIYPGRVAPEGFIPGMDKLLETIQANGGKKPIWITEFSYYGTDNLPRRPFFPESDSWSEERLLSGERECAEFTIRFLAIMMARGVEKIFIHSGASGSANATDFECCLFDYGGLPRKVFPALAVYTDIMGPAPRFAGESVLGRSGHALAFETGRQSVLVLWTSEPETIKIVPSNGVTCLDLMGNKVASSSIALSATPIYLVGPSNQAGELLQALKID